LFDNLFYNTVNFEVKMQNQILIDSLKLSPSLSLTRTLNVLPSKTTLECTS
jgi:hypothetical protein